MHDVDMPGAAKAAEGCPKYLQPRDWPWRESPVADTALGMPGVAQKATVGARCGFSSVILSSSTCVDDEVGVRLWLP